MEKPKKWSRIMIGALLVLVLAIGGTAVFAQTQSQDDPTATPPADDGSTESTTPTIPNPFSRGDRPDFDGRGDKVSNDTYLADALGITVEELQAAEQAANTAALEQAVADGLITQEQADQMSEFGGRFMYDGHFGLVDNMDELLANELGISVEALQAAQQTAQEEAQAAKLSQMVEDGYLTQEQADLMAAREAVESHMDYEGLNAAVQEAYATAVQAALDAGEITQAQADQLLSEAATSSFGHFGFDGRDGFGGHGGHDHGGRGGHGFPGTVPDSSTTTTADSNA